MRDQLVYVANTAFEANGFVWLNIAYGFTEWTELNDSLSFGVVKAGEPSNDFFEDASAECPNPPADIGVVAALTPWMRWHCYADQEITLTSIVDVPCCNPPDGYIHDPEWLAHAILAVLGRIDRPGGVLPLHIDPASGLTPPERGQVVTMTGHFGDPASLTCTAVPEDQGSGTPPTIAPLAAVLACRMAFVATGYEVIGTESMPPCC